MWHPNINLFAFISRSRIKMRLQKFLIFFGNNITEYYDRILMISELVAFSVNNIPVW